eukprot:675109-Amphidinium_carterae.1
MSSLLISWPRCFEVLRSPAPYHDQPVTVPLSVGHPNSSEFCYVAKCPWKSCVRRFSAPPYHFTVGHMLSGRAVKDIWRDTASAALSP